MRLNLGRSWIFVLSILLLFSSAPALAIGERLQDILLMSCAKLLTSTAKAPTGIKNPSKIDTQHLLERRAELFYSIPASQRELSELSNFSYDDSHYRKHIPQDAPSLVRFILELQAIEESLPGENAQVRTFGPYVLGKFDPLFAWDVARHTVRHYRNTVSESIQRLIVKRYRVLAFRSLKKMKNLNTFLDDVAELRPVIVAQKFQSESELIDAVFGVKILGGQEAHVESHHWRWKKGIISGSGVMSQMSDRTFFSAVLSSYSDLFKAIDHVAPVGNLDVLEVFPISERAEVILQSVYQNANYSSVSVKDHRLWPNLEGKAILFNYAFPKDLDHPKRLERVETILLKALIESAQAGKSFSALIPKHSRITDILKSYAESHPRQVRVAELEHVPFFTTVYVGDSHSVYSRARE
jgi:hypothetical protein